MYLQVIGSSEVSYILPPSSFHAIDFPLAGKWTYKFQVETPTSEYITVRYCRLIAYEL